MGKIIPICDPIIVQQYSFEIQIWECPVSNCPMIQFSEWMPVLSGCRNHFQTHPTMTWLAVDARWTVKYLNTLSALVNLATIHPASSRYIYNPIHVDLILISHDLSIKKKTVTPNPWSIDWKCVNRRFQTINGLFTHPKKKVQVTPWRHYISSIWKPEIPPFPGSIP